MSPSASVAASATVVGVSSGVVFVIGEVVGATLGGAAHVVAGTLLPQIEHTHSGWSMNGLRLCW